MGKLDELIQTRKELARLKELNSELENYKENYSFNGDHIGLTVMLTMAVTAMICLIILAIFSPDVGITEEHADGICQQIYGEGVIFDNTENGVIHCIEQSEENIAILDS